MSRIDRLRRLTSSFTAHPYFATDDVVLGERVTFGRNVSFNCKRVVIGAGTVIGDNVRIDASEFVVGRYATIYQGCYFPGPGRLQIGHNFWLGAGAIVDAMGGTTIDNNVGIGPQSQIWTHIRFGDTLAGCQFDRVAPVTVGADVWFVGHCLVASITARDRSMAMLGSLIVKDMEPDRTYAGSPAVDVTERFGSQFSERPIPHRVADLEQRLDQLLSRRERMEVVVVTDETQGSAEPGAFWLNAESRTHAEGHPLEHRVLRGLLPRAKFVPHSDEALLRNR